MVVSDISEFIHRAAQFFFRPEPIQVGAFIFQGVEISLHRRIVVWVSGFAHALSHVDGFAELCKSLRCILASLVAVQDQAVLCRMLRIQRFPQDANSQVSGDVPVRYAGHHAPVSYIGHLVYDTLRIPEKR